MPCQPYGFVAGIAPAWARTYGGRDCREAVVGKQAYSKFHLFKSMRAVKPLRLQLQ